MIPIPPAPTQSPAPPWSSWEGWLQSPPGQYVLQWEQTCFDQIVDNVFGFHAVQVGLPQMNCLRENRMPLHAILVHAKDSMPPNLSPNWHCIEGDSTELPFASESIDLIVLPHVLEFAADPHQILREIDRVLRPEGRLVISGFNPASLWGARQYISRLIGSPYLPRDGQFISLIRIKDWLQLLNFSLDRGHFGCYKLPLQGQGISRMDYLEPIGNRWWPIFGAIFIVSAIKRHQGIRLIGKVQTSLIPQIAPLSPAAERSNLKQDPLQ